jgi:hypothetical protein
MESLRAVINDIKVFFYGGLMTLPLSIAGTMLIIGLFSANYGMLFFLAGYLIGVPLLVTIFNLIVTNVFGYNKTKSSNCSLVIPFTTIGGPGENYDKGGISYWIPMVTFFIGYMLQNAVTLYLLEVSNDKSDPSAINNRKSHASISFGTILVFSIIILYFRSMTECDDTIEIIVGAILFTLLGGTYYYIIDKYGESRLTDLFGIANRVLKPGELSNGSLACAAITTV